MSVMSCCTGSPAISMISSGTPSASRGADINAWVRVSSVVAKGSRAVPVCTAKVWQLGTEGDGVVQQIQMTGVTRGLVDHVPEDPPQVDGTFPERRLGCDCIE